MCTGRSLSTKDLVIKTVHWRDNNGSHSAHEKAARYPSTHTTKRIASRWNARTACADPAKFVTVVGALDNEPEIAELIIRRDDNGVLTGMLETEIKTVELMD